jgi:hypothetical protein
MGNVVYYIPGRDALLTDTTIQEFFDSLGYPGVLPNRRVESTQVHRGPDNGRGVAVAASAFDVDIDPRVKPGMEWIQAERFWVGIDSNDRPLPSNLSRNEQVDGYSILLGDGNSWTIPLVRMESGDSMLPKRYTVGIDGKPIVVPQDRYREVTQHALEFYEDFMSGLRGDGVSGNLRMDHATRFERAIEALRINYHIDRYEVALLGLLDTRNVHAVLGALVDAFAAVQLFQASRDASEKKSDASAADGSSTEIGSND